MIGQLGVASNSLCAHPVMRRMVLEAYPEARLWDGERITDEEVLIRHLKGCDAAIVGFEPVTEKVLTALPELRVIAKFGAGCETIDFDALQRHDIRFGYTFGVNRLAVAELALSFMIAALRWVTPLNQAMRAGERPRNRNGRLLTGRTIGIHGCGNIGKEVIRLLKPFDCTVIACDVKDYAAFYRANEVEPVSFESLLERSEVLTLHLPKTRTTRGLYSREVLARLRPDCVLINTCRGEIVDEDALVAALQADRLRGAALDVYVGEFEREPDPRLWTDPRVLITPHTSAASDESRHRAIELFCKNLRAYLDGRPLENVVDWDLGY